MGTFSADYPMIVLALTEYVGDDRYFHVTTGALAETSIMGRGFQQLMSAELIERLHLHGKCTGCNGPVNAALSACACGHEPRVPGVLEVTISDKAAQPSFNDLLGKMLASAKAARRRARLAAVENTLSETEVALLLTWQRSLCFYCGQHFPSQEGQLIFRRDHVRPLVYGGPTTIENTVLACVSCNAKKGAGDAVSFAYKAARTRAPEIKNDYAAMRRHFRRRLADYLASRPYGASSAVGINA